MLVKNDIVESAFGMSGGFVLKKNLSELHLQKVYYAIEDRKAFFPDVKKDLGSKYEEQLKQIIFFLIFLPRSRLILKKKWK